MSTNPYDPVTTTDATHLADDDWGLNLPNIRYGSYGQSRFKSICNFMRDRAKLLLFIGFLVVLGIILISIIVVATRTSPGRKPTDEDKKRRWEEPDFGIAFYPKPADGSTVISFTLDKSGDNPIFQSMDNATQPYQTLHQLRPPYTECTGTSHPENKVCRQTNANFGDQCVKHRGWGYPHTMPCVFLQLNLPENVTIRPIDSKSLLWPVSQIVMKGHNDSSMIPVTCAGRTHKDRLILGFHGFDKGDPNPIQYYPPDGFPSFFYRKRNTSLPFVKPGMMIRVTSLKDNVMVHLKCVVWGQMFNLEGHAIDHALLKTYFAIYFYV